MPRSLEWPPPPSARADQLVGEKESERERQSEREGEGHGLEIGGLGGARPVVNANTLEDLHVLTSLAH